MPNMIDPRMLGQAAGQQPAMPQRSGSMMGGNMGDWYGKLAQMFAQHRGGGGMGGWGGGQTPQPQAPMGGAGATPQRPQMPWGGGGGAMPGAGWNSGAQRAPGATPPIINRQPMQGFAAPRPGEEQDPGKRY